MDGSHRPRAAGQRRRRPGVHSAAAGRRAARHAASPRGSGSHAPEPRTAPGGSHARTSRSSAGQARRRAAARERMLQRRRRSLGALSLLVLAVTFAITLTRPAPQRAEAAARTPVRDVPATVYAGGVRVPAGAAASGVSAAEMTQLAGGGFALTARPPTWTQPKGASDPPAAGGP